MGFLSREQLNNLGFKSLGAEVYISSLSSIYGAENIEIGDYVRIDDFTILSSSSGYIKVGSYSHIATHTLIIGGGGVKIGNCTGVSSHVSIYSTNDDYSGEFLAGPMFDDRLRKVHSAPVILSDYSLCGSHSVVLPGVSMREGSVLGANSLAVSNLEPWSIYVGNPCKRIKDRKKDLVKLTPLKNKSLGRPKQPDAIL